ncbi:MAG TPA: WecB/TagA/CpsF family glycosyltransferase [Polyangia bacterium]|nr:WecB/TagA/CpsF family glycosyltransferase [Polyangia bacterium]
MDEPPTALRNPRIDVLGVGIADTNELDAMRAIESWLQHGSAGSHYVCLTPVSGVMAAQRDPTVLAAIDGADLALADGMPICWAGRAAGATNIDRVYGPDLMARLCELAAERGWPSYFYGGQEGVARRVAEHMQDRYPRFEVAGTHCPPFRELTEAERTAEAEEINTSGARLVWVGISTPKQDLWMASQVGRLRGPVVLLGVGAAFDIHAGVVRRPPDWLGPLGLWWLYRLAQNPTRLWRRYLKDNPQFVARILRRRPRLRQPADDGSSLEGPRRTDQEP